MAPQAAIVWTAARGFARLARLLMPAGAARRPLLRPAAASVSASFSARPLAALSSSIPAAPSASEPSFSSSAVDAWTPPAPDAPSEAAPAAAGTAAAAPPASLRCDASGRVRLKALTYEQLERWVVSLDEKPSRAKILWAEMYRDGTLAPSLEACASISASSRTRLAALATLDAGLALDSSGIPSSQAWARPTFASTSREAVAPPAPAAPSSTWCGLQKTRGAAPLTSRNPHHNPHRNPPRPRPAPAGAAPRNR